jgi:hypothetical protein
MYNFAVSIVTYFTMQINKKLITIEKYLNFVIFCKETIKPIEIDHDHVD